MLIREKVKKKKQQKILGSLSCFRALQTGAKERENCIAG